MTESNLQNWSIFQGRGKPSEDSQENKAIEARLKTLPAPPWRQFSDDPQKASAKDKLQGETFQTPPDLVDLVNAALYLRRPILLEGKPGTGKSSLAYAVANELGLGEVLFWPITTRTTLNDGLYRYDAIGRLQDAQQKVLKSPVPNPVSNQDAEEGETVKSAPLQFANIGDYIQLGALGTALLPSDKPRILLIDEIDKSDLDLPNDLLNIFERGIFEIPELERIKKTQSKVEVRTAYKNNSLGDELTAPIVDGMVRCRSFPFVILTSNGERDFPAPFLRRCLRYTMKEPNEAELTRIVTAHLGAETAAEAAERIKKFISSRNEGSLATDQLLNVVYLLTGTIAPEEDKKEELVNQLLRSLDSGA